MNKKGAHAHILTLINIQFKAKMTTRIKTTTATTTIYTACTAEQTNTCVFQEIKLTSVKRKLARAANIHTIYYERIVLCEEYGACSKQNNYMATIYYIYYSYVTKINLTLTEREIKYNAEPLLTMVIICLIADDNIEYPFK